MKLHGSCSEYNGFVICSLPVSDRVTPIRVPMVLPSHPHYGTLIDQGLCVVLLCTQMDVLYLDTRYLLEKIRSRALSLPFPRQMPARPDSLK